MNKSILICHCKTCIFLKYLKVTDLEMIVEKLSQEMENMKQQLSEERQARQRLEAKISSLK